MATPADPDSTLGAERRSAIAAKSDRCRYPDMLRNGQLALAGGALHSPWTISFAKGRFVQAPATHTVDIDEAPRSSMVDERSLRTGASPR